MVNQRQGLGEGKLDEGRIVLPQFFSSINRNIVLKMSENITVENKK